MSTELMQQAAINLKKAIPLMLKHHIPATPTNYALWYAYVSEQQPSLNQQLDDIIAEHNTCPPSNSTILYREFVSDPVDINVIDMRQNLEAMATELSQSLKDTNTDASHFQEKITSNFEKLSRIETEGVSLDKVLGLVRSMVKESDELRSSTQYFTDHLQRAQQEINTLKAQLKKSEKDVLFDALTQVLNRRAFDADLKGALNQAPEGVCLILIDIDHFKAFNDNYGHQLGDQVLKSVAKRLGESCKEGTKLYRYGGEEFVVITANSELRKARQLAEAMRRALEKISVKDRRKNEMVNQITASFGVAQWQPSISPSQLVSQSDSLLYEAKRLGRNRVMPILG